MQLTKPSGAIEDFYVMINVVFLSNDILSLAALKFAYHAVSHINPLSPTIYLQSKKSSGQRINVLTARQMDSYSLICRFKDASNTDLSLTNIVT